ncbi:FAD-dependent oxidoreductase [Actimicrobium sp. CCI2.3]|uniref:FAD-dependent oxidoreductase n=1 Tax=Actimicrobium sp. CCI2.3 TaxID=3048616 RepID=UPI002AB3E546|nr:FAD-dependent oxidoreductase [Actimicrobium sp. CCI2.3]MDY7575817.1 FAD-dependent oxidoreductase [Actimicrobium sp. CCI2.3]MEB0021630.1 FAD-dependent oxidoreductase [Actimicrobium sp. CCI2.3]
MTKNRLFLLLLIVAAIIAFFVFDLGRYLSLEELKSRQEALQAAAAASPLASAGIFFLIYTAATALSFPGATILTLGAGAIFGLWFGTLIVSFASCVGATLAFLSARFILRDWVIRRFGDKLKSFNEGIARDGALYLFTLRLVPVFPFFLINLLMGLTVMPVRTYYWVSQLGMLAGTLVFVNAGTQLAQITSLKGILSPGLLLSFVLLGVFPLIARKALDWIKARKVYARWPRPARFDYNMVVIGGGSAGLVSAYIAAAVKAKVALIERHQLGGDCLNTGCIPSKTLIRSAKLMSHIGRAHEFGLVQASAQVDFAAVMERVQRVIATIAPHDSAERYQGLGVDSLKGSAHIVSPFAVELTEPDGSKRTLTTRNIVIAAGARPFMPPIPGLDTMEAYTSETLWSLRQLPRRLLVLGGGPIGCELAQAFARLGAQVTQVEMAERVMLREDADVSAMVASRFRAEGIALLTGHKAVRFLREYGQKILVAEHAGSEVRIVFDDVLVALGRSANLTGYGLEELGIGISKTRTIETNDYLETLYPNIFAAGDVAGPYQFTHVAAHQAWFAAVNGLFGRFKKFKADYSVIPWATFTEPEVARVGLNEQEAIAAGVPYEVSRYALDDLDRAIADGEAHGFVKVLTVPGKDKILGVTIVGDHAGDLIAEYVMAMKHGLGMNKILGTIHIYPTLAEANKFAAGVWKKAHTPERLLRWVAKYHAWQRG